MNGLLSRRSVGLAFAAGLGVIGTMWFLGSRGEPEPRPSEIPAAAAAASGAGAQDSGSAGVTGGFAYRGNLPAVTPDAADAPGPRASLSAHAVEEIRRCAGGDSLGATVGGSLDPLLSAVQTRANQEGGPNASPLSAEKQYENYHIILPSGEERRIQVTSDSSPDGTPRERLRQYAVDEEGLPVPLPGPASDPAPESPESHEPGEESAVDLPANRDSDSINPSPQAVRALVSQGKLVFSESSWIATRTSGNRPGRVTWKVTNGRVSELQWIGADSNLGCAITDLSGRAERPEVDCDCRK